MLNPSPDSDRSKVDIFGVGLSVTNYADATRRIIDAARNRESFAVSALATHGLMEAVGDPDFLRVVNEIDLVTPDGQPVRWAMNLLHDTDLSDRVYGPDLTWQVCGAAAEAGIGIYLFGSKPETCERFAGAIRAEWPAAVIAGIQPDRFREATDEENADDIARINDSGAGVILVGRGCPRQERWVHSQRGKVFGAMLAVGAAFDYHAGTLAKPPALLQRVGLEWLWRLALEPRRLAWRYLTTNSRYIIELTRAVATKSRGGSARLESTRDG